MKIIAIGGPHGSGKSSVAKRLAEDFGMNFISAGVVFRSLAEERGLSVEELSEIATTEPSIDRQIDLRTKELGSRDNTVVDAQLAAFFTPTETAIRICITASKETRWKRIAKRDGKGFESARQETETRERTERQRFLDLYSIDVNDLSQYDVILNTDRLNEEQTFDLCKSIVEHALGEFA
ncbi:MAG: cytidylate kinase family protein [Candidatus Heimdallarchaeota archaeon]|nr:cytidylate kinase family protein [Candidatus Heimdallarchaeota archaeon]